MSRGLLLRGLGPACLGSQHGSGGIFPECHSLRPGGLHCTGGSLRSKSVTTCKTPRMVQAACDMCLQHGQTDRQTEEGRRGRSVSLALWLSLAAGLTPALALGTEALPRTPPCSHCQGPGRVTPQALSQFWDLTGTQNSLESRRPDPLRPQEGSFHLPSRSACPAAPQSWARGSHHRPSTWPLPASLVAGHLASVHALGGVIAPFRSKRHGGNMPHALPCEMCVATARIQNRQDFSPEDRLGGLALSGVRAPSAVGASELQPVGPARRG